MHLIPKFICGRNISVWESCFLYSKWSWTCRVYYQGCCEWKCVSLPELFTELPQEELHRLSCEWHNSGACRHCNNLWFYLFYICTTGQFGKTSMAIHGWWMWSLVLHHIRRVWGVKSALQIVQLSDITDKYALLFIYNAVRYIHLQAAKCYWQGLVF